MPRWAQEWIPGTGRGRLEAWVLEESVVDPPADVEAESSRMAEARSIRQNHASLVASTKNISFKKMLHVVEGAELFASSTGLVLLEPGSDKLTLPGAQRTSRPHT